MSRFRKKAGLKNEDGNRPGRGEATVGEPVAGGKLKTPRAAAIAGIIFSLLIATSSVLIRLSLPDVAGDTSEWLTNTSLKGVVIVALNLVPFAGIAFLWFIGVIRDRLGEREDRFFATVFFGSGLLYIAMLFASAAIAAGLVGSFDASSDALMTSGVWDFARNASFAFLTVYAMKMAAVFTISTATLFMRTATAPRWMVFIGYAVALVLLLGSGLTEWLSLLFPAWVLLVSIYILVETYLKKHEPVPVAGEGEV
ncbi:MAG: hypothetical protein ACYC99_01905 [Candidatus Geothermincolia bacterium]